MKKRRSKKSGTGKRLIIAHKDSAGEEKQENTHATMYYIVLCALFILFNFLSLVAHRSSFFYR